jgi:dihydroxyacid dehydratase/phosphogluconate dehydratase
VFTSERDAIAAVKGRGGARKLQPGDVLVLMCRGPLGSGMEETYQLTSALRHLPGGKEIAIITDARFSGVSTGPCIGHVGPEALAGGPLGKLRDGDLIEIVIDCRNLTGTINFIGTPDQHVSPKAGAAILAAREPAVPLVPDPQLPPETRLWALLQQLSGGTWGGCVYDTNSVAKALPGSADHR